MQYVRKWIENSGRIGYFYSKSNVDELVKSTKTVMPDLIPAEDGIFDRHPEQIDKPRDCRVALLLEMIKIQNR